MATGDADGFVHDEPGGTGRMRGRAFEAVCLAATAFGLVSVLILLLFVAKDAFRPFSADLGWHAVYAATFGLPVVAIAGYYYWTDEPAGEVAYVTTGLPVVGVLLTGGFYVLFLEIVTVDEWLALIVATLVAVAAIVAHGRLRPRAALERLAVLIVAPAVAYTGLPPAPLPAAAEVAADVLGVSVGVPRLLPGVPGVLEWIGVFPPVWLTLLLTLTLPVAALAGRTVARRRDSDRAGLRFAGVGLAGAASGLVAGPLVGLGPHEWVLAFTFVAIPPALYVEGVLRRREGVAGLAFPVVAVLGLVAGAVLVRTLGFAGPEPWLDLGFLTSAHSRTPEEAGIYPPMVGSVMMLIVIVLSTFPVGVGAAIYLEEYAPSSGWAGRLVELIEINIGNLAGVPSVVYGLLGLALFIRIMSMPTGSVIVGGLAVGLLILPIVIIAAQEAIRSVPDSYRKASYGMGATRWQTTRNVVLPEALPGILTGTILALGRAIGETAPLLMIGAPASIRLAPNGFSDSFTAMPRQIFSWASEIDPAFRHGVLAAGVVTLVAVLLVMNATAIVIRNKYQRQT